MFIKYIFLQLNRGILWPSWLEGGDREQASTYLPRPSFHLPRAMDADKEAVRQLVGGLGLVNFHEALQTAFNFADKKKSPENLRRLAHRYHEANQNAVKADEEKRKAE